MKLAFPQIRQHAVALISLAVALLSLSYNTWRNEQTEANRNVRAAGIELLLKLGELDQVVFFSHFDHDEDRGSPRAGWAYVLTVKDLASLVNDDVQHAAAGLVSAWGSNWQGLGDINRAEELISGSIEEMRAAMLHALAELD